MNHESTKIMASRRARQDAEKDKEEVILSVTTKKILLSACSAPLRGMMLSVLVLWD